METALARNTDPGTSHAAAASVYVTGREQQVIKALRDSVMREGTSKQIAAWIGVEHLSISPRMKPLVKKGLIVDSGKRSTFGGGSRKSIVWALNEQKFDDLIIPEMD